MILSEFSIFMIDHLIIFWIELLESDDEIEIEQKSEINSFQLFQSHIVFAFFLLLY